MRILIVALLLLLSPNIHAAIEPEQVPPQAKRMLDITAYQELARQWQVYIDNDGESARALANLSRAYRYGLETDSARKTAERAVELDGDYYLALESLGILLYKENNSLGKALELLEHCRKMAPDYGQGLKLLAAIYMKRGELEKADEVLRDIYARNLIPKPMLEYGYNMLVGLPRGAVLFTNGDSDTFPPLVQQAGTGFRSDVAVLNRNLLDEETYVQAAFRRYPLLGYKGEPGSEFKRHGDNVLNKIVDKAKVPLYLALHRTHNYKYYPELEYEGLNHRVVGTCKGLTAEESANLFLSVYKFESATDPAFPWKLYPSIVNSIEMYAHFMIANGGLGKEELSEATFLELRAKIKNFVKFHDLDGLNMTLYIMESLNPKLTNE